MTSQLEISRHQRHPLEATRPSGNFGRTVEPIRRPRAPKPKLSRKEEREPRADVDGERVQQTEAARLDAAINENLAILGYPLKKETLP